MKAGIKTDYPAVPAGVSYSIRLLISLDAEVAVKRDSPQLNIALVLDRSGSMAGEKLRRVKEAATEIITNLKGDDYISLTAFDSQIDVIFEPIRGSDAGREIIAGVEQIDARGCTFLWGGYKKGYELVKKHRNEKNISRIILLTDGLANEGLTDPEILTAKAAKFAEKNIITTTIGVGEDFDEKLLGMMAKAGKGNTYYIETPAEAAKVFSEELGSLMSVAATETVVRFIPSVKGVKAGQFNNFNEAGKGAWFVGDVYAGRQRTIMLELGIPAQEKQSEFKAGELQVTFMVPGEEHSGLKELKLPVILNIVGEKEFEEIRPDREVTRMLFAFIIAETKRKVLDLMESGDYKKAAALIAELIAKLKKFDDPDEGLLIEMGELEERKMMMETYRERYYDADKKRLHYESSYVEEGKMYSVKAMYSRREKSHFNPLLQLKSIKKTITGKNKKQGN